MTNSVEEPRDPKVEQLLQSLQPVPERSPQAAADGRARFLSQAAAQPARKMAALPVSASQERRHSGWFDKLFRKELPKMSVLATVMLIVALVFGGSGAVYAAAQDTLPDQPLYGLKVAGEDLQLKLTANEQNRLELALKFSQRRVGEMEKMANAGKEIPASVQARWQQQVQECVQLAYNLPEESARTRAMLQIHEQLQTQAQLMNQTADVPLMEQARQMIQQELRQVEQIMSGFGPGGKPEGIPQGNPGSGPGEPGGPQGGGNPWTDETPTPGSSYGPGPGTCENCTPQGTKNTPQGTTNTPQGGNNPWTTGTPTPGSSYGPGPGTCENCTPQGTKNTPQGSKNTPQGTTNTPQGSANTPQGTTNTPQGSANTPQGSNPYTSGTPTPGSSYGPGPGTGTNTPTGPQGKP